MSEAKYAILGDIHGNWEALSAVLEDAHEQGVTHFVCVGDIVGYNAEPVRCLETVMQMGCVTVMGNHDHYCSSDSALSDFHPRIFCTDPSQWLAQTSRCSCSLPAE